MKARTIRVLILISLLVFIVGTAAAPMNGGKTVKLLETRFIPGKGVVFIFEASGLSKSDLNSAYANVGGNALSTDCRFKDDGNVACTVKDINRYAGQSVMVGLAGQGFWATVPGNHICYGYSYSWSYEYNGETITHTGQYSYDEDWTYSDEKAAYAQWGQSDNFFDSYNQCIKHPVSDMSSYNGPVN